VGFMGFMGFHGDRLELYNTNNIWNRYIFYA
jgi:hypothetical protein